LFSKIEARLLKLETANRFTAPVVPALSSTPTVTGLASGDPSNPRVGDIWLNTTANTPKYVDSTGAVTTLGGSATSFYIYTASSTRLLSYAVAATAQSLLSSSTTGFIVNADTAYEYEFFTGLQFSGLVTQTPSIGITAETVTLTNAMTHVSLFNFGSNTTGFTTANTLSAVRTTSTIAITASGTTNRYYDIYGTGIIRVTGTGTARIYPSLTMNTTDPDNVWTTQTGLTFKLTPLGSSSVTTIGTIA